MANPVPWYLEFARDRNRQSSRASAKPHIFTRSTGCSATFWELRTVVGGLQFPGKNWSLHEWWRRVEGLHAQAALRKAGLDPDHVRVSMKSALATAAKVGIPVPAESAHLQEYTASTHAVVVLLCRWSLTYVQATRIEGSMPEACCMTSSQWCWGVLQMPDRPEGASCTRPSGDTRSACRHCAEIIMQVGRASDFDTAASQWHFQARPHC